MVAELVAETSRCHVPVWNGDVLTLRDYETAALWFRAGLKPGEQDRAVARLWANLQGPAKEVARMLQASMLVPDASQEDTSV